MSDSHHSNLNVFSFDRKSGDPAAVMFVVHEEDKVGNLQFKRIRNRLVNFFFFTMN